MFFNKAKYEFHNPPYDFFDSLSVWHDTEYNFINSKTRYLPLWTTNKLKELIHKGEIYFCLIIYNVTSCPAHYQ